MASSKTPNAPAIDDNMSLIVNNATLLLQYADEESTFGMPISSSVRNYLNWLDNVERDVMSASTYYMDAFTAIALDVGRTPIDSSRTFETVICTNSNYSSAAKLLSKIGNPPLKGKLYMSDDERRVDMAHAKALCFIKSLVSDPVIPGDFIDSSNVGHRAGIHNVAEIHKTSVNHPGDPEFPDPGNPNSWDFNHVPLATLAVDARADRQYGANLLVCAGRGSDVSGAVVTQPEEAQTYVVMSFESTLATEHVSLRVGTVGGIMTSWSIPLLAGRFINKACFVFALPEIAGDYEFASISVNGNEPCRVTFELCSFPVAQAEIVFSNADGQQNPVVRGANFSEILDQRHRGTDNAALYNTSLVRFMNMKSGIYEVQTILRTFVENFGANRSFNTTYYNPDKDLYVDPANWDRFVKNDVDSNIAVAGLLSMAQSDILTSRLLCSTDSTYSRSFIEAI
jgi:hypothetical protein